MKKLLTVVLTISMILAFTACGSSDSGSGGSVKLGEYTGLSAVQNVYKVTDEAVDEYIQNDLEGSAEQKTVDVPAKEGNGVNLLFTITQGDEVLEDFGEESYDMIIGDADYSEEFDQNLIGLKSGDEFEFTFEYGEGDAVAKGVVNSVFKLVVPKYNDAFVKDMGYDSKDAYESAVKDDLAQEYEETSQNELLSALFDIVVENSEFKLTDSMKNDYFERYVGYYTEYAAMFGMEYEDMLEFFGVSEDDIKVESEAALKKDLVVKEIAKAENLDYTDEEYADMIQMYADADGYDSAEEYLEEYGEEDVKAAILESAVGEFLIENGEITQQEAEYQAE